MPDWVSTRTAVTPDGAACTGPRNHILHPNGPDLRSGEVLVYQARPSPWTNQHRCGHACQVVTTNPYDLPLGLLGV